MQLRAIAIILSVAGMAFAGCVREPDESGSGNGDLGTACATDFVTTHWEGEFDKTQLREAFEAAGYEWTGTAAASEDQGITTDRQSPASLNGVAQLDPPGDQDVRGVVAYRPGPSANESLILSWEETTPSSQTSVLLAAQEGSQVVNETFEGSLRLDQWIADSWTGSCGEPGGIPPGPG